ncbi:hypothetical protein J1N35_012606 [Gossypium stocksii]|uniref:Protein kinase domain-containing protein n=1 Tax=Gossypium stocksii TaxID=47602 RepID=A0A9D4AEK4_9ROSI|nr:hypothetical protein J1N35_012606 [Gossypium stocksii]
MICNAVLIYWKIWKPAGIKSFISESKKHAALTDFFSGDLRTIFYFDFRTLKRATKNFHPDNLLGKGGFGPVYKGKLKDGRMVAVKRLSHDKSQQGESEFLAEVRLITSIQHKNLVRLLGCCSDGSQRLLAWKLYERSRVLDLVDPRLKQLGSLVEKDVVRVVNVAFFCLQLHPNLRPPMSEIVTMLTCTPEMVGTPSRPAFFDRSRRKKNSEKLSSVSWDTMPDPFPSPLESESMPSTQAHTQLPC